MSAAAAPRTARFYTAARRHPWVMGKLADWRLPLGPYNAAQIALATVGGFLLVKTISVWSVLGPIPVAAWLVGIWLLRRPKIGGRHPVSAAMGMVALAVQPAGGRIGQRAARDPRARRLGGGFTLEDLTADISAPMPPQQAARRSRTQFPAPAAAGPAAKGTRAAALLAQAQLRARNQKGGR
ncbi:hypothetical protein [Streptomyces sp. NPDC058268]|uniref:hypothetical protein n=1 Tax=Streptomyces sp. NPDC058268 TaxID=3346413 RepID=UPI0036E7B5DD